MEKTVVDILKGKDLRHVESNELSEDEIKKARSVLSRLGYI